MAVAVHLPGSLVTARGREWVVLPESTPDFVVAKEQVWGWDALENFLVQNVDPGFLHALFPAGGGGVSHLYFVPCVDRSGDCG